MNNLIDNGLLVSILQRIASEELQVAMRNRIEALHVRELVSRKLARYQGTTLVLTDRGRRHLKGTDKNEVSITPEDTKILNDADLSHDQQST